MGLIDFLFRRNRASKNVPTAPVKISGQFETSGTRTSSRRASAKRKSARKRSKESRRRNR
jgi:hypothetical protein